MRSKSVINFIFIWIMAHVSGAQAKGFTNMWIAEISGGEEVAQRVARDLGYTYKGQLEIFEDHYVLTKDDHPELSPEGSHHLTQALLDVDEVKWAEQQSLLERSLRGNIPKDEEYTAEYVEDKASKVGSFSTKPSAGADSLSKYDGVTKNIQLISSKPSAYAKLFNDPKWPKQWYYQDYRTEDYPVMDHNVVPVYKMGITGKGVIVAIVDDGLQNGHPDLQQNYNYSLSWDYSNNKPGSEPDPPTPDNPNSHGTECAGMVGMVANNSKCGVGAAYNAILAGVKVLGIQTVSYSESRGLAHKIDQVSIYSCSWGPGDTGRVMEPVLRMTDTALTKGITKGRGGKGSIYTFAAGNGRNMGDNCGADGYMNHIATIAVAAAGQNGKWSYYSERCTAVYTTAYSGTDDWLEKTVATDLNGGCSLSFSGTSSATPLISGIFALTLQANPKLTYRDVMHLITMSSEVAPLADNGDIWYQNGRGFWVSNDFGFGLLNAENMVTLAKSWTNVPKKNTCFFKVGLQDPTTFTVGEDAIFSFDSDGCKDSEDAVAYLEQVQVVSTIEYPYRGAISMTIYSPAGTESLLLEPRPKDNSTDGLNAWTIKTVHNWGEDPTGTWTIVVAAKPPDDLSEEPADGYVKDVKIYFHGTTTMPAHYKDLPRQYAAFRLPNGQTSQD